MKILHVTPDFLPVTGGIQTFVHEISKRLIKDGNEVTVLTRIPPWYRLPKRQTIDGMKILRVPFNLTLRYSHSSEAFKLLMMELDYDVINIHVMGMVSDLIPFMKLRGKKIIFHTHGGIFHEDAMNLLKNFYFETAARINLSFADSIVAHSLHDKKLFSKICDKKKITLINYGIDWKKYSKVKRKGDGRTLIYVGRLDENKRLDRMINVLAHVKKDYPDVRLLFVGKDWGVKNKIKELASRLDVEKNIVFVDSVPHEKVLGYLSEADVFLLSSDYEGFGISIIEAMATGMPVVVNDIEAAREIIKNGQTGFYMNFDDYEKTASVIKKLLSDKNFRKRIGKNAIASTSKYDWDVIYEKIKNVYEEMEDLR